VVHVGQDLERRLGSTSRPGSSCPPRPTRRPWLSCNRGLIRRSDTLDSNQGHQGQFQDETPLMAIDSLDSWPRRSSRPRRAWISLVSIAFCSYRQFATFGGNAGRAGIAAWPPPATASPVAFHGSPSSFFALLSVGIGPGDSRGVHFRGDEMCSGSAGGRLPTRVPSPPWGCPPG
jgi:hypothetical protein